MSKQPWALILGASSGFGEATALELARAGMNIFGVHLDRRDKLPHVEELNIGHSVVSRAIFVGLAEAVRELRDVMDEARSSS